MRSTIILLSICGLLGIANGFRPIPCRSRLVTGSRLLIVVPEGENRPMENKNWWQQLVRAFVQAFPEVMRPPKEMDPSKVIYDPASFEKVRYIRN